MAGVETCEGSPGVHHEGPQNFDPVSEALKGLDGSGRNTVLHLEDPCTALLVAEAVATEAPMMVQRVKPGCVNRLLRAHVEDGDVEQDLERLLVLTVTARAAESQERLSVAEGDGRGQRRPGALSSLDQVRVPILDEDEGLHPIPQGHSGVPGDEDPTEEPG